MSSDLIGGCWPLCVSRIACVATAYREKTAMLLRPAEAWRQFRDHFATVPEPESFRHSYRDYGHRCRGRELGPLSTIYPFMLQVLYGNITCTHLPHFSGIASTDSAYGHRPGLGSH
jgi:hypothetical protein